MAYDRQQILRVVNGLLASGVVAAIVAGTITATTSVTAPLVQGQNTAGTGDCQTDYCGVTPDELVIEAPASTCMEVPTGGTVCSEVGRVLLQTLSAGDDIIADAFDSVQLSADSGNGGYLQLHPTTATLTGGDIAVTASGILSMSATTSATLSSSGFVSVAAGGGGNVVTDGGGVTIQSLSVGDDITLSAADDLVATITDDVTATCDAWSLTGATSITNAVTSGGSMSATSGGVTLAAASAGDDITLLSADDVTITATGGPLLLQGGTGQLQIAATGGIFNAPVQAPMLAGGLAYRAALSLEFDYVNAAPSGTSEELMADFAIPAGALVNIGSGVAFEAWGTEVATANSKLVRIEIGTAAGTGGTSLSSCNFSASPTGTNWHIAGLVYRSAADAQRVMMWCVDDALYTNAGNTGTAALDDALELFLNFTVANTTAAGDLTVHAVRWTWL